MTVSAFNQQMKAQVSRTSCPTERSYMEVCTAYASDHICRQLSVAKLGKYRVTPKEDGTGDVSVCANGCSHTVSDNCCKCSCGMWKSMGIPCCHIFAARMQVARSMYDPSLVAERWMKKHRVETGLTSKHEGLEDKNQYCLSSHGPPNNQHHV